MKKMLCIAFVFMLILCCGLFLEKNPEDFFDQRNILSIKAIVDNSSGEFEGVFNGCKAIIEVEKLSELNNIRCCGATFIINKTRFGKTSLFDFNNIIIVNKYKIDDNKVYDCKILKHKILGFSSMQIVEKGDCFVVGVPMILNDF